MEGLTKYYVDHPRMIQEAIPWENMRRIHLLSIETLCLEVRHLESKLDEIQRNSSLNLKVANIELGHQIATKGKIRWEVVSMDITRLHTRLVVFCAQEDMKLTRIRGLYVILFSTNNCKALRSHPRLGL